MERESRLARNERVRERVRNENFITFIVLDGRTNSAANNGELELGCSFRTQKIIG